MFYFYRNMSALKSWLDNFSSRTTPLESHDLSVFKEALRAYDNDQDQIDGTLLKINRSSL